MADDLEQSLLKVHLITYEIENLGSQAKNQSDEWRVSFTKLTDVINYIQWKYAPQHFCEIVSSDSFLEMLISDDRSVSILAMSLLRRNMKLGTFEKVPNERQKLIIQELIYKLSQKSATLARESTETLSSIVSSSPVIEMILQDYPMFPDLLAKWSNCGFDKSLLHLQRASDNPNQLHSGKQRIAAATVIQAAFRGYIARKRLNCQKSSCIQKQHEEMMEFDRKASEDQRNSAELLRRFENNLIKIKSLRRVHEYKQDIMESTPSSNWLKCYHEDRVQAAICIQKSWRGYKARKLFKNERRQLCQDRAARIIQKMIRKWLFERRLLKFDHSPHAKGTNRDKYKEIIANWMKDKKSTRYSREQQKQLHGKAQSLVFKFLSEKPERYKLDKRLNALQAHVDTDISYIGKPSLEECNLSESYTFSASAQTLAKKQHLYELSLLHRPWLRHLEDAQEQIQIHEEHF